MDDSLSEFDLEKTLEALEALGKAHGASPTERGAIELAARALLFLQESEKLDEFREHVRLSSQSALLTIKVLREFGDMPAALEWLRHDPEARPRALIKVAGTTYVVAKGPAGERSLVQSLTPRELDERTGGEAP